MSDIYAALALIVMIALMVWWIRHASRRGTWRHRGGIVYRAQSPKLFGGIIILASVLVAFIVLMLLLMANRIMFCDADVTPRACLARTFHASVR